MELSDELVASFSISSGRKVISDAACRGLYLDVRPHGKSWRYRFTNDLGQSCSVTIGDATRTQVSAARKKVAMLSIRRAIKNGLADRTPTYAEFVSARYLPFAVTTKKSACWEEIIVRCHLVPAFGAWRLDQISPKAIREFVQEKRSGGYRPGSVNRMLSILKVTLGKALEWETPGVEQNPARGVRLLRDPPKIDRFLSQSEAERLMTEVALSNSSMLRFVVPFLLFTGARKREALDSRWEHINFDQSLWTIPITKAGKPRYVPLSPQALAVLRKLESATQRASPWLFPSPDTGKPYRTLFYAWDRARTAAGLKDVRMHDLRHSFASAMINNGMGIYDVKEALGHSNVATTQRYAHLSRERLREAVNAAGTHYSSAVMTT